MSDSDSCDCDFISICKSPSSEDEGVILDPSVTLCERQRSAEIRVQINQINEQTKIVSTRAPECSEFELVEESEPRPAAEVQEIRYIHPGRCTFIPNESCCIFSEENLHIKDFKPSQNGVSHMVFDLSDAELLKLISRNRLKKAYYKDEVVHHLCSYLFLLASVHRDKRIVDCSAGTILSIRKDWFPSVDIIFRVFINWGIRSEILEQETTEMKRYSGESRILDFNIQKILEIISSSARGIGKATSDDKMDKLIKVLALSALEPRADLVAYSQCICSLLRLIPEERWNYSRVQKIAELLFCEGNEDCHNLLVVCDTLLVLDTKAQEVARFLACMTLNKMLSDEMNQEPLDWLSCQDICKLLSRYDDLHELKLSHLYNILKLVELVMNLDFSRSKLTVVEIRNMIVWLSTTGGNIMTVLESTDCIILKEMISRCVSTWRIMMKDVEDLQIQSLCNTNSVNPSVTYGS